MKIFCCSPEIALCVLVPNALTTRDESAVGWLLLIPFYGMLTYFRFGIPHGPICRVRTILSSTIALYLVITSTDILYAMEIKIRRQ